MSCPIFTIQNEAGDEFAQLLDGNGVGNAIPTGQAFRDLDIRQDYATGDVGKSPIRLPHEIILSMDWVEESLRNKLLQWKFERERVAFSDMIFGSETVFAFKPVEITGGGHTDLTGGTSLSAVGDAHLFSYWNPLTKEMEDPRADNQTILSDTEFGPANLGTRKAINRAPNPYPESATEGYGSGKCGWVVDESGIGHVTTLTHNPNGFSENSMCPDSLLIQSNGVAGTTQVWCDHYFDPTDGTNYGGWVPPATSTVWVSIWVKGQFPPDSSFEVGTTGDTETLDLTEIDTSEWTRIDLGKYNSGVWADVRCLLNLTCGTADFVNFEIGPVLIGAEDYATPESFGGPGHFTDQTAVITSVPTYIHASSFDSPLSGTATIHFSVPDRSPLNTDDHFDIRIGLFFMPYITATGWDGMIMALQRSGAWSIRAVVGVTQNEYFNCSASDLWSPGIHSVSIVWGSGSVKCYLDGRELESELGRMFAPASGTLYFNGLSQGPHTGCALRFHGFHIQNRVLSAGEIQGIHAIIADTVARNLVQTAQGRLYEIVSVPSTPLIQDGFTRFMGDLRLRQVIADPTGAAWFAEDE